MRLTHEGLGAAPRAELQLASPRRRYYALKSGLATLKAIHEEPAFVRACGAQQGEKKSCENSRSLQILVGTRPWIRAHPGFSVSTISISAITEKSSSPSRNLSSMGSNPN